MENLVKTFQTIKCLFLPSWVWNLYLGQVKYLNVYASFVLIIIFSLWKKIFRWWLTNHKRLCSKSEMTKVLTFKDCSLPDPTVHGILQARILEWVVIPSLLQGIFTIQGWTQVSCIAGRFFTTWAPREVSIFSLYVYTHSYVYIFLPLWPCYSLVWQLLFFSLKTVSCLFFCISTSNSILDIKV